MRPIDEQTILITGATDGLGRFVAAELGRRGARVVVHGRNAERAAGLRAEIAAAGNPRVEVLLADFSDLAQVARLADDVLRRVERLDVLVNNAGIGFGPSGSSREVSANGIELRFAVNYLAGYSLTRRLVPLLVRSAPARIINVSSAGQAPIDFADPLLERDYTGVEAYMRSKLAQVMFTIDLAEELRDRGVTVNALHPATYMNTTMVREAGVTPWSTVADGAAAVLHLVTDPAVEGVTGEYFNGLRKARAHGQAYDARARAQLRALTDRLIRDAVGV